MTSHRTSGAGAGEKGRPGDQGRRAGSLGVGRVLGVGKKPVFGRFGVVEWWRQRLVLDRLGSFQLFHEGFDMSTMN